MINENILQSKEGYYIKEKNEYKFLPFERLYSIEELIKIIDILKSKNTN